MRHKRVQNITTGRGSCQEPGFIMTKVNTDTTCGLHNQVIIEFLKIRQGGKTYKQPPPFFYAEILPDAVHHPSTKSTFPTSSNMQFAKTRKIIFQESTCMNTTSDWLKAIMTHCCKQALSQSYTFCVGTALKASTRTMGTGTTHDTRPSPPINHKNPGTT
jgi:hypothetical protein